MKIISLILLSLNISKAAEKEPHELRNLRETRETHVQRIDLQYVQALKKLKLNYTKAGDLDSALLVVKEIEKIEGLPKEVLAKKASVNLNNTQWDWGSGGTLSLNKDKTVRHTSWKLLGRWEQTEKGFTIWKNEHTFTVTLKGDSGSVVHNKGGETTLKKIK